MVYLLNNVRYGVVKDFSAAYRFNPADTPTLRELSLALHGALMEGDGYGGGIRVGEFIGNVNLDISNLSSGSTTPSSDLSLYAITEYGDFEDNVPKYLFLTSAFRV